MLLQAMAQYCWSGLRSCHETLTFGETTKAVSVIVLSDTLDEFDETFNLTLANPVNTGITTGSATVTVEDSDAPPTLAVVVPTEVDEGDDVDHNNSSNASAKDISFSYNVSGVSAEDVATTSGIVNISAGETTSIPSKH